MTWPTVDVDTTDADSGTDVPATARADLLDLMQKFNQLRDHVSVFSRTFLDDADAAAVKATLELPLSASLSPGSAGTIPMARPAAVSGVAYVAALRSHLAGLGFANNAVDPTNDIDIAVGGAMSDDNTYWMTLASALTKRLDAVWAVGNNAGMRASGAAIANGTYHIFLIARPDTGVVDIAADTSATGANIAANTDAAYTKKRRIFSIMRESAAIVAVVQAGDYFRRKASILMVNQTNPGINAVSATLGVPLGINVFAFGNAMVDQGNAINVAWHISDLAANDEAPGSAAAPLGVGIALNAGLAQGYAHYECRTNGSAQVRYRLSGSGTTTAFRMTSEGWIDRRGRDD